MSQPCKKHPDFQGLRMGRQAKNCPGCMSYYLARQSILGEKEKRVTRTPGEHSVKSRARVFPSIDGETWRSTVSRKLSGGRFQKGDQVTVIKLENDFFNVAEAHYNIIDGPYDIGNGEPVWHVQAEGAGDYELYCDSAIFASLREAIEFSSKSNSEVKQRKFREELLNA